MTTTLTLTMSKSTVEKDKEEFSPKVKSLMGSFKTPKNFDFDYKKEKIKRLEEK